MDQIVFVALISFLLGFKFAAHIGKRYLERMKSIWLLSAPQIHAIKFMAGGVEEYHAGTNG